MTLDDLAILRRQYENALDEMAEAAIDIADTLCTGKKPELKQMRRYSRAKLGVASTRKDIEENLDIEIEKTLFRD